MIRVTLGPECWTFDEESMRNTEAIALQKTTGMRWAQLTGGLYIGNAEAITALVWLCRRRAGVPDADNRYSQLDFDLRDFDWEPLDEEGRVLRFNTAGEVISRDGVPEPGYGPDGQPVEAEPDPTPPLPEPSAGS